MYVNFDSIAYFSLLFLLYVVEIEWKDVTYMHACNWVIFALKLPRKNEQSHFLILYSLCSNKYTGA